LTLFFFIGYQSGKNNGFGDSQSLYGKIILSAILFFNFLSFINILHLFGFKSLVVIKNLVFLFTPLVLIFVLVFVIYNQVRIKAILNKKLFNDLRIKTKFNLMLIGSLLLLFITTVYVGPQA
jgi:hypothetical protein